MAFRTNKTPVLQTKSASGAVATFNTALAMPLSSCKIAVNAWQEGSGDPSPVNNRPIHGFSEVNVTANNAVTTIQLGQEVYGAEVDVVNGVAHCTHRLVDLGGSSDLLWRYYRYGNYDGGYTTSLTAGKNKAKGYPNPTTIPNALCNKAQVYSDSGFDNRPYNSFTINAGSYIKIKVENVSTAAELKTALNGTMLVYELATPFDIQLTPAQIETLIGNNTIFADTGDIDLTYKDLDIAKRGNFREVFRLPFL